MSRVQPIEAELLPHLGPGRPPIVAVNQDHLNIRRLSQQAHGRWHGAERVGRPVGLAEQAGQLITPSAMGVHDDGPSSPFGGGRAQRLSPEDGCDGGRSRGIDVDGRQQGRLSNSRFRIAQGPEQAATDRKADGRRRFAAQ